MELNSIDFYDKTLMESIQLISYGKTLLNFSSESPGGQTPPLWLILVCFYDVQP